MSEEVRPPRIEYDDLGLDRQRLRSSATSRNSDDPCGYVT